MNELVVIFENLYDSHKKNLEEFSRLQQLSLNNIEVVQLQLEFQGWISRVNHSKKELNLFLSCLSRVSFHGLSKRTKYPVKYVE